MERVQVRARPAEASTERARVSPWRRALADANALLPWRDRGTSAPKPLALYVALAPVVFLVGRLLLPLLEPLEPVRAAPIVGIATVLGYLLSPWAVTFGVSLAVSRLAGRGRLHEALVCPYCRDAVDREGTVICARTKCGALYHRECWEECHVSYGGCAVYGCSSRRCREVSAAGFAVRIAKLLVAAALFPPRAVRALRRVETESAVSVYWRSVQASRRVYSWTNAGGGRQAFFVLVLGIPLSYAALIPLVMRINSSRSDDGWLVLGLFATIFLVPFTMLVIPYLLAIPVVFVVTFLGAIKRALESEFSALERADQGGGTVLGRLASGFGKK